MFYGPSPFYRFWVNKFECAPTGGDFYYNKLFDKYFVTFYVINYEEYLTIQSDINPFTMQFQNETFSIVSIKYAQDIKKYLKIMLPVLDTQIACSVNLIKDLEKYMKLLPTVSKFTTQIDYSEKNLKIVNVWLKNKLNDNKDTVKLLCFFHNDHNPSAIYNFKTCYFKCFACHKFCKNLYLHLKRINHPILSEL